MKLIILCADQNLIVTRRTNNRSFDGSEIVKRSLGISERKWRIMGKKDKCFSFFMGFKQKL